MTDRRTLAEVVGMNARAIRLDSGATLDDVARAAKRYGLKWNTGRVGDLESGRIAATAPTLFALAATLASVTRKRVALADLVRFNGWVELNEGLTVAGDALTAAFTGEPVRLVTSSVVDGVELRRRAGNRIQQLLDEHEAVPPDLRASISAQQLLSTEGGSGVAEKRVAKSLGISDTRLAYESARLWGRAFSAERDERAGSNANAQKRGQVARELKSELRASLSHGDD